MGQVSLTGTLQGGPPTGGSVFPSSSFTTQVGLSQNPKSFQVATGVLTRLLSDTATFVEMTAVGVGRDVPKANFLYIRAESDYDLRITQDNGQGGSTVSTSHHRGVYVSEFPDSRLVTLVEIAASTKLEYFASGP